MGAVPLLFRGVITTNDLNVRSGPGVKFEILEKLKKGSEVTVLEESKGFLRISDGDQWVSKQYVKKTE
jgi:uncharacterized protein YgiM (DUF1202 family)